MNFASDNWAGATDAVMTALMRHKDGFAPAYGADAVTAGVKARFASLFERDVEVYFTATGTGANALAMAAAARPGGAILASRQAHIHTDEWGASEFMSSGMKIVPLASRRGLVAPGTLAATLAELPAGGRFGDPAVLSLTQAAETGAVYDTATLGELAGIAHGRGLAVHMDGARFANALVALDTSPAAMTWEAGIDILSFGGTKNGCWAAEALVVFTPQRFPYLATLRARAGHLMSKSRFVAAQFEGYFEADGWLATARHANAMAQRLAEAITASGRGRLAWRSEANEVFAILDKASIARLRAAGAHFHGWSDAGADDQPGADEDMVRLVTSFATQAGEVDRFAALL